MIFKYETRLVQEKNYITGSQLVSEKGVPSGKYEFAKPFMRSLLDKNDRLQWTIRDNPDYDPKIDHIDNRYIIEKDPIPFTPEELQAEREAEEKADYIKAMPDLVKNMVTEIEGLKTKIAKMEAKK